MGAAATTAAVGGPARHRTWPARMTSPFSLATAVLVGRSFETVIGKRGGRLSWNAAIPSAASRLGPWRMVARDSA
jgi:hypothetical protein